MNIIFIFRMEILFLLKLSHKSSVMLTIETRLAEKFDLVVQSFS